MRKERPLTPRKKEDHFMKITIGSRIRQLRRKRSMTQEQLADLVGVSYQAVSKWENDITLPDVLMMPRLAVIFGTTIDDLYSFDRNKVTEEVMEFARQSWESRNEKGDPEGARRVLADGLAQYPDHPILLGNLLATYDWDQEPDAVIGVAERCLAATAGREEYSDIRCDTYRFLAHAYKTKGDPDAARAAVERIPEIYFSKLSVLAEIAEGAEKYETAEREKYCQLANVLDMMLLLVEYSRSTGDTEAANAEAEKARMLIGLFDGKREHARKYYSEKFA